MRLFSYGSIFTRLQEARYAPLLFYWIRDEDFVAAPITSQSRNAQFDLPPQKWREAGLNVASTVRIQKLTVLAKDEIVRRVGTLSNPDQDALGRVLRSALCI